MIFYTEKFVSQFEQLPIKIQNLAYKKIILFENNPKHPSLRSHKLHGVLEGYYSFSIDMSIRIVFEYRTKDEVFFLKIGTHDIYR